MAQRSHFLFAASLIVALSTEVHAAEIGGVAPNCALAPIVGGKALPLESFRGKVVLVDFWTSWCGPCAQSFDFMNGLDHDLRDRGLQVLAVNLDENPEDAQAFLSKHPARFNVVADAGGQCPQDFGVEAMPSSYVIDRQGVIRHVHLGFRPGEARKFRAAVEQLLAQSAENPAP